MFLLNIVKVGVVDPLYEVADLQEVLLDDLQEAILVDDLQVVVLQEVHQVDIQEALLILHTDKN